MAIKIVGWFF